MDSLQLPPGFKFKPKDEELLTYYLKPKILGKELPCNIIVEKQIYGPNSNPWDMFDFSGNSDKIVYVFSRLTKKAAVEEEEEAGGSCIGEEKRTQYVKKAGCGTWHGSTPRKKIMDKKKNVIGTKRLLVFQINDVSGIDLNRVGYYRMHEYLLLGYEDYALCQITLDTTKNASVVDSCPKDASTSVGTTKPKTTKKASSKAVPKSVSTRQPKASKKTVSDCRTAKLCSKTVSRSVSTTKPKANKTTDTDPRTAMHERSEQVVLTESCRQESVALVSSVCPYGSDQGFVNKGLPQYGDVGSFRVEENVCQGLALGDYDQGLTYEEVALFMMNNTKDSHECNDVITSDLLGGRSWSEKDIEDLFEQVPCGNNVQQRENMNCNQALERSISFEAQVRCSDFRRDNVTLNIEDLFDDFWTEEYIDNFLKEVNGEEDIDNFLKEVLNDSDVQQQQPPMRNMSCSQGLGKSDVQQQQPPMQNMSCSQGLGKSDVQQQQPPMQNMSCSQGLGKRKSFEAQECCSSGGKKLCR